MIGKKAGCGISAKNVIVTCPKCHTSLKLKTMRNYKCPKCHEDVVFFDIKTGKPHEKARFIKCPQCNASNFEGMVFCYKCKTQLPPPARQEAPAEKDDTQDKEIA